LFASRLWKAAVSDRLHGAVTIVIRFRELDIAP